MAYTRVFTVDFEKLSSVYHCFFPCHVCLSNLKHAPSRELLLTAHKTVFSHLKCSIYMLTPGLYYMYIQRVSCNVKCTLFSGRTVLLHNRHCSSFACGCGSVLYRDCCKHVCLFTGFVWYTEQMSQSCQGLFFWKCHHR